MRAFCAVSANRTRHKKHVMPNLFISCKSEDRSRAEQRSDILVDSGFTTWWDTSVVAGERFADTINDELNKAKAAIVLWSKLRWNSK